LIIRFYILKIILDIGYREFMENCKLILSAA
jgi:hypothetical protein